MTIPFHQVVDNAVGMFVALSCKMEVDHGGVQAAVPQILLDPTDIDACLQEVSGIGMSQGMNGDPFCELKLFKNAS